MKQRIMGAELELFLTRDWQPATPTDWKELVTRATNAGWSEITEPYSGFPLGASCNNGWFVLDNNCAIIEFVSKPYDHLDKTIDNLQNLISRFEEIAPDFQLHWTSQFGSPDCASYWQRSIPSGLYGVVRHQKWEHWRLMNAMAFQPAIDVRPSEITAVLRSLFLCAPLFVYLFDGRKSQIGNGPTRLQNWLRAISHSEIRTGLPEKEIHSLEDYVENLLDLPAFILSSKGKNGQLIFFEDSDNPVRVSDVMFDEVAGQEVRGVIQTMNPNGPFLNLTPTKKRANLSNFYSLSLPFWHVRLVFELESRNLVRSASEIAHAISQSSKLYVELRHIGTPRQISELKSIYALCLRLIECAEEVERTISPLISWEEAKAENTTVIQTGQLGPKSRAVYAALHDLGIFHRENLL